MRKNMRRCPACGGEDLQHQGMNNYNVDRWDCRGCGLQTTADGVDTYSEVHHSLKRAFRKASKEEVRGQHTRKNGRKGRQGRNALVHQ